MADPHTLTGQTLTALGSREPRVDTFDGLSITEDDTVALASLAMRRGKNDQFARAVDKHFTAALPKPGRMVSGDPFSAFWTAPDQWFVQAPLGTHENLSEVLKKTFKTSASITEQSGGWARFVLQGPGVNAVMERLTMLDVRAMRSGHATRTLVDHLGVFLLCHAAGKHMTVLGPRSSAGSLHHALITAARSAL